MAKKNRTPLPGSESFEALGKVWYFAPLGPAIAEAFAAYCRMKARRDITQDKALKTPAEFKEDMDHLRLAINAGEYDWGPPQLMQGTGMGPGVHAVFSSDQGRLQLVRLLLQPAHDELSDEEINALFEAAPDEAKEAFEAVFFSAYPWLRPTMSQEQADPSAAPNPNNPPTPSRGGEASEPGLMPISSPSSAATAGAASGA